MCGISGLFSNGRGQWPHESIEQLTDSIANRGPDGRNTFFDLEAGIALGHQRLAVVDISENGSQPMTSPSGRFVMVLNGEIYNYRDLRAELEALGATEWRGTSDTEVLLNGIEYWGLERTLVASDGMFSIAVWDKQDRKLTLARDRFGEKPLIVAKTAWGIAFSSQLAGLMRLPGFINEPDEQAIDQFLALSYIPEPRTPFLNVFKVPPGTYCIVSAGDDEMRPITYWSASASALSARQHQSKTPNKVAELKQAIETRFLLAVKNQMLADVPIGAFLSGGIDSSLVVAAMQEQSTRPVKTFTIGFEEASYNEAHYASAVAEHLGSDHTQIMVTACDVLDVVPRLADFYEEPFADSSQLPTYLVSRAARSKVTVALTGDAGDEIFGGYNRHVMAARYGAALEKIPNFFRTSIGAMLTVPARSKQLERMLGAIGFGANGQLLGEKVGKVSAILAGGGNKFEFYQSLVRRDDGLMPTKVISEAFSQYDELVKMSEFGVPDYMMMMDTLTYLPGDILTKVDRASMAVALETRAPFLDHKLFELAWQLPVGEHIKDGQSKVLLREMLAKRLPKHLFERPKAGFGVPISMWLRGPLKDWLIAATTRFCIASPRHRGAVNEALLRLESGSPSIHHFLWNVAMLQSWRERHL